TGTATPTTAIERPRLPGLDLIVPRSDTAMEAWRAPPPAARLPCVQPCPPRLGRPVMDTPHVLDQPITLAPAGHDLPGEAARLRALGPLIRVTLPGGIPAWYPTRHDVLEQIILHPEVGKD